MSRNVSRTLLHNFRIIQLLETESRLATLECFSFFLAVASVTFAASRHWTIFESAAPKPLTSGLVFDCHLQFPKV
jgi:hypothetical protein